MRFRSAWLLLPCLSATACALIVGEPPAHLWDGGGEEDSGGLADSAAPVSDSGGDSASPVDGGLHDATFDSAGPGDGSSDASGDASGDAAKTTDAASDAGKLPDADAAPPDCGSLTTCDDHCVNVTDDSENCGYCGRSCGGDAGCANSYCKPALFATDPGAEWVQEDDGNLLLHVFPADGSSYIDECSIGSCTSFSSLTLGENIATAPFVATDGTIYAVDGDEFTWGHEALDGGAFGAELHLGTVPSWTAGGGYYAYVQLEGLEAPPSVVIANPYAPDGSVSSFSVPASLGAPDGPIATDGINVVYGPYYEHDGGFTGLNWCAIDNQCATPAAFTSVVPDKIELLGGVSYLIDMGTLPADAGVGTPLGAWGASVSTCSLTGCDAGPTALVSPNGVIEQTAVDSTGVYWLDNGGNIWMCPSALATCPGTGVGVVSVDAGGVGASSFAIGDGLVWFLATADASSSVYVVAEP